MRDKRAQSGFTLVEVTIAAVIGSFIAVIAIGALRAAASSRENVEKFLSVNDELRFASNLIRRDIQNVYRSANYGNMQFLGSVSEDSETPSSVLNMKIVSTQKARPQRPESDVYVVEYFIMTEEEKNYLMRRYCPVVGHEEPEETQGGILIPVGENIVGFEVRYFDGTEWLMDWPDTQESLPGLVEVTLAASLSQDSSPEDIASTSFMLSFPRSGESSQQDSVDMNADQQENVAEQRGGQR
ncbi:type II secretion system protein J [Anaerohalosphaera lusitana]|uniref:Type II secretion system protein J n=1 Tax=Anaerohalosphaera lusitana TaxID=1936003 RepID=A0A1U9NK38_9BACT|nr:type II secretion system protein GspJ [Anaerohalosphaera lusitana]AQT68177.1 type II secretion system protein J [Anaerohalosphaera lusitana]